MGPRELALYLQSFDRQKRSKRFNYLGYVRREKSIKLNNDDGFQLLIDFSPHQMSKSFKTGYYSGIKTLRKAMAMELAEYETRDIVVLITGGSYQSQGLQEEMTAVLETVSKQAEKWGTRVNWGFLGQFERH